jgi:hypothetical protein
VGPCLRRGSAPGGPRVVGGAAVLVWGRSAPRVEEGRAVSERRAVLRAPCGLLRALLGLSSWHRLNGCGEGVGAEGAPTAPRGWVQG